MAIELSCTGCGAKMASEELAGILKLMPRLEDPDLLVGFEASDDAAVYRLREDLAIVQTVDFFPPMVEDWELFGRIAATNALSDLYAMGAKPKLAMNLFCAPRGSDPKVIEAILRGGYLVCQAAGVHVVGGHSLYDTGFKYGLAATGLVHPDRVWRNQGAKPGDLLYLTKPLGVGLALTARIAALLSEAGFEAIKASMLRSNAGLQAVLSSFSPHAVTDVTGFGLMGHLREMLLGSEGLSAHLVASKIPSFEGVLTFAEQGLVPEATYSNARHAQPLLTQPLTDAALWDLLCDPQTSGGLLIALSPEQAPAFELACLKAQEPCYRIGWFEASTKPQIEILGTINRANPV